MNRDRLVGDAKEVALALVRGGYRAKAANWQEGAQTTQIKVLGEQFLSGAKLAIHMMQRGGYITDYDAHVGRKLGNILAGGALSSPQFVSEQYVLDLERNFVDRYNHELIDISRIHPEAMQSHVQHLEALLERHVAETASVWAEQILNDLRTFLPKFWVVKPKAASIDSLIDSLRRAA